MRRAIRSPSADCEFVVSRKARELRPVRRRAAAARVRWRVPRPAVRRRGPRSCRRIAVAAMDTSGIRSRYPLKGIQPRFTRIRRPFVRHEGREHLVARLARVRAVVEQELMRGVEVSARTRTERKSRQSRRDRAHRADLGGRVALELGPHGLFGLAALPLPAAQAHEQSQQGRESRVSSARKARTPCQMRKNGGPAWGPAV